MRNFAISALAVLSLFGCTPSESASGVAKVDDNRVLINMETIYLAGEHRLGTQFPNSEVPGFKLARGTLAGLTAIAEKVKSGPGNYETDILPILSGLEDAWPDRFSKAGLQIEKGLWSCRDAVSLGRMQFDLLSDGQSSAGEAVEKAAYSMRVKCNLALSAITVHR
jgi:hypothetical protein